MKILNKITILFLGAILFGGCDKDLEIDPISTISFNSFYKTEDDAQLAINGMYAQFRNVANSFYLYGDERADNTVQTDLGTGNDANRNTLKPTTDGADWGGFYRLINDANLILRFVPDIEFVNESDKNQILAEAAFARAWGYFMIARSWGDAPMLTEGFTSSEQEGIFPETRSSVDALFDQIKSDLDKAIAEFPDSGISSAYRASQPAAYALKADVYLWTAKRMGGSTADLNIALEAINNAIANSGTTLLDNYANVFRTTEATQEDVFSIYFDVIEQADGGFFAGRYNLSDSFYNQLPPETREVVPFIQNSVRFYSPSETFRNQITANAGGATDNRQILYFLDFTDAVGAELSILNKYQGMETSPGVRQFTDDYKIYRLGGLILMKAEILNGLGQTAEAVIELNKTRNRAGIGDYVGPINQADINDAILAERGVELGFEGKRWFDLIRFGKAFELVPTLQGQTDEGILLWPLSTTTLSLNPALNQNPFYK